MKIKVVRQTFSSKIQIAKISLRTFLWEHVYGKLHRDKNDRYIFLNIDKFFLVFLRYMTVDLPNNVIALFAQNKIKMFAFH